MSEVILNSKQAKIRWAHGLNVEVNFGGGWSLIEEDHNLGIFDRDDAIFREGKMYVNIEGFRCVAPLSQQVSHSEVTLKFEHYEDAHIFYNSLMINRQLPF